jgi:hypothetical protein
MATRRWVIPSIGLGLLLVAGAYQVLWRGNIGWGFGTITDTGPISRWEQGFDLGFSLVPLVAGQEVVIDYEATVRAGAFWISAYDFGKPLSEPRRWSWNIHPGDPASGSFRFTISETAIYKFSFNATSTFESARQAVTYDLDYQVHWGVRNPGAWFGL